LAVDPGLSHANQTSVLLPATTDSEEVPRGWILRRGRLCLPSVSLPCHCDPTFLQPPDHVSILFTLLFYSFHELILSMRPDFPRRIAIVAWFWWPKCSRTLPMELTSKKSPSWSLSTPFSSTTKTSIRFFPFFNQSKVAPIEETLFF